MIEIWKDIPGFEGAYQASTLGRVRSRDKTQLINNRWGGKTERFIKGKILISAQKHYRNSRGYPSIILCFGGKKFYEMPHRLVAKTFLNNPDDKPVVHHLDSNSLNNNINNLMWATYSENNLAPNVCPNCKCKISRGYRYE